MIEKVKIKEKEFKKYKGIIEKGLFLEIKNLASKLKGKRIIHINSTALGGGVAEILRTLVPLMKSIGLEAEWYTIPGDKKFFDKKFLHDSLQGAKGDLPDDFFSYYLFHLEKLAKLFKDISADAWVIHDPQPAGLINFLPDLHPSICRLHIDTSHPNKKTLDFLLPILNAYDRVIFSMNEFACAGIQRNKIKIFRPAIDPFSSKNKKMSTKKAKDIVKKVGINPEKPLVSQVARFDPWKDPIGSINAYQIAKCKIPNLQFAFLGFFIAKDDPGAERIYKEVKEKVKDKNVFLFADPKIIGKIDIDTFVNAIQTASNVILQKSIREGFGLVVSEAMWKEKVVIGGNVGGIKSQIKDSNNGFLVNSSKEAAERIIEIFQKKEIRKKIGKAAKETVRKNFLMPRLLKDYLYLFEEII